MTNRELPFIKEMFDNIAPRYDFLNHFLSLRQDILWRRKMIGLLDVPASGHVLDVACGTGDVAFEALKQKGSEIKITGTDFSPGMLDLFHKKIQEKNLGDQITLAAGNALALPFPDELFHGVTIAFGIRNINDKLGALKSFYRCMKKGGVVLILELGTPESRFFRTIYLGYFEKILPAIGKLFSKNDSAYSYLPESVLKFPKADDFSEIMHDAGFSDIRWKKMTCGIVTLFSGRKK